ncbi:hypothetical protein B2J88_39730 [Rhodococcus sp. SRB_17]|nr:hypothetical protein [Rhodococcus sp. SRB_17]
MVGTSQGNSYPEFVSSYLRPKNNDFTPNDVISATTDPATGTFDADLAESIARAEERINKITKLNADSDQRGNSWCLPVDHQEQAQTPLWTSRAEWQRQVRELLNTDPGTEICRKHQVDTQRVFAVAVTMAGFAEQRTGRRVTASRAALAEKIGISVSVVQRARRVLSELNVAKEMVRGRFLRTIELWAAEAHHGGRQTRAASVWALVSPRSILRHLTSTSIPTEPTPQPIPHSPKSTHNTTNTYPQSTTPDPLSVVLAFSSSSSVRKNYTNARTRMDHQKESKNHNPKPISLQRAAAELIRHAPALMPRGHIGAISNALSRHSIDTKRWSGRDIARTLDEDTKSRGWTWPNASDLNDPVRFLHWRLARIDWSVASPTELAAAAKNRRDEERRAAANKAATQNQHVASPSARAAARALFQRRADAKSTTSESLR